MVHPHGQGLQGRLEDRTLCRWNWWVMFSSGAHISLKSRPGMRDMAIRVKEGKPFCSGIWKSILGPDLLTQVPW